MKMKFNIALAALAVQRLLAGTFANESNKSQGAQKRTPADATLIVFYTDHTSRGSQEVLGANGDVEDYQAAPQGPQILVLEGNGYSTKSVDLAVHDDFFALSLAMQPELVEASFDLKIWGQSLGKALELAKIKAQELHLEQVAADIEQWVVKHPWKAGFYAASALGFFAPEILSIPALEALGFGAAGVRAGKCTHAQNILKRLLINGSDIQDLLPPKFSP